MKLIKYYYNNNNITSDNHISVDNDESKWQNMLAQISIYVYIHYWDVICKYITIQNIERVLHHQITCFVIDNMPYYEDFTQKQAHIWKVR